MNFPVKLVNFTEWNVFTTFDLFLTIKIEIALATAIIFDDQTAEKGNGQRKK